jgi:hypothetical protein
MNDDINSVGVSCEMIGDFYGVGLLNDEENDERSLATKAK